MLGFFAYPREKVRDSSLISTSVRMVHLRRTSDEKRPGRGRQRINPREFATTGPRTPETAANFLLHRGLRQDGGGDQRGVSKVQSEFGASQMCQEPRASARRFPVFLGVPPAFQRIFV